MIAGLKDHSCARVWNREVRYSSGRTGGHEWLGRVCAPIGMQKEHIVCLRVFVYVCVGLRASLSMCFDISACPRIGL